MKIRPLVVAVLLALLTVLAPSAPIARADTARVDCVGESCPSIVIPGDDPAPLWVDGSVQDQVPVLRGTPRGHADPTVRADPNVPSRVWMGYSWPYGTWDPASGGNVARIDTHLAHNDGDGWVFDGPLWQSEPRPYPTHPAVRAATDLAGRPGYVNSEAVSIAPGTGVWYSARMEYWTPGPAPLLGFAYLIKVAKAPTPPELDDVDEQTLGGANTDAEFGVDVRLNELSADVANCNFWIEPALFVEGEYIYLALKCMTPVGQEESSRFNPLFRTTDTGPVAEWDWSYVGMLTGPADVAPFAAALEEAYPEPRPDLETDSTDLSQIDIARAMDGTLLVIASPSADRNTPPAYHFGCVVAEIEDLSTATIRRVDGKPVVRAMVIASDLYPSDWGPAACGYDAASDGGLLITRRTASPERPTSRLWSLNQTFLHP